MITAVVLFFLISVTALDIATRHGRDRQFAAWQASAAGLSAADLAGPPTESRVAATGSDPASTWAPRSHLKGRAWSGHRAVCWALTARRAPARTETDLQVVGVDAQVLGVDDGADLLTMPRRLGAAADDGGAKSV